MILHPSTPPRERILTMGIAGTGKSNAILTIARRCPNDMFHILDNDFSYDRLLATDYADLSNVTIYPMDEWADYTPLVKKLSLSMGRDDWLAIDSMTATWDAVQSWFIERVHGQDIDEYFLAVRMAKGKGDKALEALSGWMDWPVINKSYFRLYTALLNVPGHTYITSEVQALTKEDTAETRVTFGNVGVKPKGQKRLLHMPHTALLFTKTRQGEYRMTTIKDRGRVELDAAPLVDFSKDYLMRVGKWRPITTSQVGVAMDRGKSDG